MHNEKAPQQTSTKTGSHIARLFSLHRKEVVEKSRPMPRYVHGMNADIAWGMQHATKTPDSITVSKRAFELLKPLGNADVLATLELRRGYKGHGTRDFDNAVATLTTNLTAMLARAYRVGTTTEEGRALATDVIDVCWYLDGKLPIAETDTVVPVVDGEKHWFEYMNDGARYAHGHPMTEHELVG